MYTIKVSPEMGRGIYSSWRVIQVGEVVTICEILLLSPEDTKKVNDTELKWYTFKVNDLQDCLVLGDGEIFNHADTPNVSYTLEEVGGRLKMVFRATKVITRGEQLFIDYGADSNVNAKEYIDKASLIG